MLEEKEKNGKKKCAHLDFATMSQHAKKRWTLGKCARVCLRASGQMQRKDEQMCASVCVARTLPSGNLASLFANNLAFFS